MLAAASPVDGAVVFRVAVAGVLLAAGWGAHRALATYSRTSPSRALRDRGRRSLEPVRRGAAGPGSVGAAGGYAALLWWLPPVRRGPRGTGPRGSPWSPPPGSARSRPRVGRCWCWSRWPARWCTGPGRRRWSCSSPSRPSCRGCSPGAPGPRPPPVMPRGVDAFAARAERVGGVWASLLATGGISEPVPGTGSLTSWTGQLLVVAVLVALVVGGRRVVPAALELRGRRRLGFVLGGGSPPRRHGRADRTVTTYPAATAARLPEVAAPVRRAGRRRAGVAVEWVVTALCRGRRPRPARRWHDRAGPAPADAGRDVADVGGGRTGDLPGVSWSRLWGPDAAEGTGMASPGPGRRTGVQGAPGGRRTTPRWPVHRWSSRHPGRRRGRMASDDSGPRDRRGARSPAQGRTPTGWPRWDSGGSSSTATIPRPPLSTWPG